MYKMILVALALDQGHGPRALELARQLKSDDGAIVALHVIDEVPGFASYYMPANHEDEVRASAKEKLAERVGDKKDAKTEVLVGHPGRTIAEYAENVGADCIIIGSHKPELQDFLLGSTAARVVRHAPCSVHVLR